MPDMVKKLGKDLKVGDVIKDHGIVLEVDVEGKNIFWGGKPNITTFDISDSYYGPGSRELRIEEEFEIYTERKDLIWAFKKIDCDLSKYIADMMEQRKKLSKIHRDVFDKLNEEKRKQKANA